MHVEKLLQLPEELLYLWHTHRLEILLTAGVLVGCVRLAIHWRSGKGKVVLTPSLGSPVDEKKTVAFADAVPKGIPPVRTSPTRRTTAGPKRVTGVKQTKLGSPDGENSQIERIQPYIFYYSLGGSTRTYAEKASFQADNILRPIVQDLTEVDYEDFSTSPLKSSDPSVAPLYLFLLPSYDISTELDTFIEGLKETHHDFRIDTAPLRSIAGYAVLGFGDGEGWPSENEGFCKDAAEVDRWMAKLSAGKRAWPVGMVDVKGKADLVSQVEDWMQGLRGVMDGILRGEGLGEGAPGSGEAAESGDEDDFEEEETDALLSSTTAKRKSVKRSRTADLEDMKAPVPVDFTTTSSSATRQQNQLPPKAMVPKNSPTYTSLTKQGYSIIGTHAGVKTCRWTKSALRGRGSCYKYSFYGIASHRCMEATPSLSCSNKCVFCWRHGTNPVGTHWRWQVDPPEEIFHGMLAAHTQKIKTLRGVPGVRASRFLEGLDVKHCALSLVGEPIFYPHINRLLDLLHEQHISTFLVCNAQHPDQLQALGKVTQLYVSIDASNKESLKKIDRPLHRDYWERFVRCMDILRSKRFEQRTVFRLTLVKGFNIEDEAEGYADLVERALPGFVEVKGVTYCGTSTAAGAGLSMRNVPFYEEVSAFVLALEAALQRRGLDYGIAAEHAHSCCILLADKSRFYRPVVKSPTDDESAKAETGEKRWHTLISYRRFFENLESGEPFGPEQYIGEATPEWALWGNGGFDPRDERVDRKGRPKEFKGREGIGSVQG